MIATAPSWSHVFRFSPPSQEVDSKDDHPHSICLVRRTQYGPQYDSWIPSSLVAPLLSQPFSAPESTMVASAAPVAGVAATAAAAAVGDSSDLTSVLVECSVSDASQR